MSSQWKPIPADAYKGECKSYKANLAFDHASYTEWKSADTFAIPTTDWYREEVFDMSDNAGYSTVAFKFVIKKGTYFGSFIADGWHIDDFEVNVSPIGMNVPDVYFINVFSDTINSTGPFSITVKVATRTEAPILRPWLYYKTMFDTLVHSDSILMANAEGDSVWKAVIPQQPYGTDITYYVIGSDSVGNRSRADGHFFLKAGSSSLVANEVALYSIDYPKAGTVAGKQPVRITIRNRGTNPLTIASLGWSVNGVLQAPKVWTGSLRTDMDDMVTMGSYIQRLSTYDTIVVWVSMPNNMAGAYTADDTLSVVTYGCDSMYHGTYVIGNGGKYPSLNGFMSLLNACGTSGNVEIKMVSGIYTERLDLTDFSPQHHVTVSSLAGNADSVVFRPAVGNAVTLDHSSHVTFRNLTFDAGAVKNAVYMTDSCVDVEFNLCKLIGDMVGSSYGNYAVYCLGRDNHNIRFVKNDIRSALSVVYLGDNSSYLRTSISYYFLDSNSIMGAYWGISLSGVSAKCRNNLVKAYSQYHAGNNNSWEGISVSNKKTYGGSCNVEISGNCIYNAGYNNRTWGIYVNQCDNNLTIANNEIILRCDSSGGIRGLSMHSLNGNGPSIVNNSIYLTGNNATASYCGLYFQLFNTSYTVIRNNNVILDTQIISAKAYPIGAEISAVQWSDSYLAKMDIDYNNWAGGSALSNINQGVKSLKALRGLIPSAIHDTNAYPVFADTSAFPSCMRLARHHGLRCEAWPGVTTDMEGSLRFSITEMGAYTLALDSTDAALSTLSGWPSSGVMSGDTLHPSVVLRNEGRLPLTEAMITWTVNGVTQGSVLWKGYLTTMSTDTIVLGKHLAASGYSTVKVFLSSIGNMKDSFAGNDTVAAESYACSGVFNGKYTVGDTGYFKTLDAAISVLQHCGMQGPVTLALLPDTYVTNTVIPFIEGMGAGYSLTVTSATGDSSDVVLVAAPGSCASEFRTAPIIVDGGQHVRVTRLTLVGDTANTALTTYSYAHALMVTGTSGDVEVSHCMLVLSKTHNARSTSQYAYGNIATALYSNRLDQLSSQYAVVFCSGNIVGLNFMYNTVSGGNSAFYLEGGGSSTYLKDAIISRNIIRDNEGMACQTYYVDSCVFEHNKVSSRTSPGKAFCIGCQYSSQIILRNNSFRMSGFTTGILVFRSSGSIINNEMSGGDGAIHIGQGAGFHIYHNSFYTNKYGITSQVAGIPQPIYFQMFATGTSYTENNIFHVKNGNPVLVGRGLVALGLKSNCYYNDATATANLSGVTIDAISVSKRPVYMDTSYNLAIGNTPDFSCDTLTEVPYDINGMKRNAPTVMGAFEGYPISDNLGLIAFAGLDVQVAPNTYNLGLVVANYGVRSVDSALLVVYSNGVRIHRAVWVPRKPLEGFGQRDTVWLGNKTLSTGHNDMVAFVRLATDTMPYNDTIRYNLYVCSGPLAGTYTVGGNSPDFTDMEILKEALYSCGISAPVTVRIRPGNYGSLSFTGNIPGGSSYHILFVSDNGRVVFDGGNDVPGLKLATVNNMSFQKLVFGNLEKGNAGVSMTGKCTDVTIKECEIYACTTVTAEGCYALDIFADAINTGIRITGNRVIGGYCGMRLRAASETFISQSSCWVDSNVLSGAYRYGIHTLNHNFQSLSHNRIVSRYGSDSCSSKDYCAFYSENRIAFDLIDGNRLDVRCSGSGMGMNFNNWSNANSLSSNSRGLLINNDIRVSSRSSFGICINLSSSRLNIHHNNIYSVGEVLAYGINTYSNSNTINKSAITRNLISVRGKGDVYPLYFQHADVAASAPAYGIRQWNNLYAFNDSIVANISGNWCYSLESLINITGGNDSNSVCVRPAFADTTVGLDITNYRDFDCPMIADVPYDINGMRRNVYTSMGAYDTKVYDALNVNLSAILQPQKENDVQCISARVPVIVAVRNSSRVPVLFDSSALEVNLDVTGPVTYHWDTVISSGMLSIGEMDSLYLTDIPVHSSGTYHIRVTLKDSADLYPEDDTLSMDYTLSRIQPPYDQDFSAVPAELVNVRNAGSVDWEVVRDSAMPSAFGTGRLEFAGAGNPGASASAVFNAVDIQGCVNPMLSFWYAHGVNSGTRDILYVFATTDGGASYTTIGRITPTDTTTGWRQYDIDLSRFANASCLSIVFQAISFGGANQSLDRIRITADADAALTLLPVDFSAFTACENDAVPLKVVVSNITAMPVEYSSDTIRATVTGASNQGFTCVYSKSLVGYESDTITLGGMDLRANGNYYINVSMQSQDDNAQNDTASDSTILIRQDIAMDSIIGIDAQTQHLGGDTVYVSALVRNNCNMAVDRFTVTMELNGETVVTDTVLRHMEAGDSIVHAVSMPYVVPFGTKEQPYYFLELSADIPCDGDANNDKRSVVGIINVPDTVDLQVLSIAQPATDSGRVKVSPKVTVANIGNVEVQNVMLHVDVLDSAMTLLETVSEYINFINVNDTLEYAFSLTYTVPNYDGSYYLKAYADTYANETNTANDTLTAKFACKRNSTGIVSHTAADWSVGQNEPNPASATTTIPFVIPEDAEVALTIMGVNGQLLHREIVTATAGANRVTLQTGTLPSGLYYYGVEYKGQRIVRKMNVVR